MARIKKSDEVIVITGKDRLRRGKVIRVLPAEGRVVVEGMNLRKKHVRPRRAGEKGQTVLVPQPLAVSKVMLVCPVCSKPTRTNRRIEGKAKVRVCKKCGNPIG